MAIHLLEPTMNDERRFTQGLIENMGPKFESSLLHCHGDFTS